jgi:ATP adenylyltransferase
MMNKFPYTNGHLMVVPRRHCLEMEQLSDEEGEELFHLLQTSVRALRASLGPQGFNIGLNLGKVSGAGEEHLHFHIVPRWAGDTNFMPVLAEAKIIPESLDETYRKLDSAFRTILGRKADGKGGKKR